MRSVERRTPPGPLLGLTLVALAAMLAGCGLASEDPTPDARPSRLTSPTASVSPTPSPTATTTGPVLSTAGLGPLRMGSGVPPTGLARWDATACVAPDGPYANAGEPYAGMWVPTVQRTGDSPLDRSSAFGLLTRDGTQSAPLDFLQVWSSEYRTPSGLHVGSTDAEVRKALPRATVSEDGGSRWYSVVSGGWRITFTVVADSGDAPQPGSGSVQLISVYPASDPDSSWWNTDVGAHCPA